VDEIEKRYARHVLQQLEGRRMDAAKALGLSYPTFLKKLGE
jgi:two-component system response regulator AtoC